MTTTTTTREGPSLTALLWRVRCGECDGLPGEDLGCPTCGPLAESWQREHLGQPFHHLDEQEALLEDRPRGVPEPDHLRRGLLA
jgi:hypothetical protein